MDMYAITAEHPLLGILRNVPLEKTIEIIKAGRGQHFDPRIVDCFIKRIDDFSAIADKFADHPEPGQ